MSSSSSEETQGKKNSFVISQNDELFWLDGPQYATMTFQRSSISDVLCDTDPV